LARDAQVNGRSCIFNAIRDAVHGNGLPSRCRRHSDAGSKAGGEVRSRRLLLGGSVARFGQGFSVRSHGCLQNDRLPPPCCTY
jgi:hypothetical protein